MVVCNALESIQQVSKFCQSLQACSGPHGPQNAVAVARGELTLIPCDAYVLPSEGPFADFGNVSVTPSGGGNSQYFLNAIITGIPFENRQEAQKIVVTASRNALYRAKENGFERIVFSPLGTDSFAKLTAEESAKAIFGALFAFWDMELEEGPHQVIIAVPKSRSDYKSFCEVLLQRSLTKMNTWKSPS